MAKKAKYLITYRVPKNWKLKAMKFFGTHGCPPAKDNPLVGCRGAAATTASGFKKWVVNIAVLWKSPDKSLVAHTYAASLKNGCPHQEPLP